MQTNFYGEAVDKVRWYQHTNQAIYGKHKKEVRSLSFQEDYDCQGVDGESQSRVSRAFVPHTKKGAGAPKSAMPEQSQLKHQEDRMGRVETAVGDLQKQFSEMTTGIKEIQSLLSTLGARPRFKNVKPGCFKCGEVGHFARECLNERKVSQVTGEDEQNEDLNSSGSDV